MADKHPAGGLPAKGSVSLLSPSNLTVTGQASDISYTSNISLVASGTAGENSRPSSRVVCADELGMHRVTFMVTISVAFPTGPEDKVEIGPSPKNSLAKLSKKVVDAPRNQRFLHCEYLALPGDSQPVQTDVVLYGRLAAKIFTDQLDAKIVQAWSQDDVTWVSWSNCHSVTVTESLLTELIGHSLVIRVWDKKEKCSPRARFDKPKAFRLPHDKPSDDIYSGTGVQPAVLRQCDSYQNARPKQFMSPAVEASKENHSPNKVPTIMPENYTKVDKLMEILRQKQLEMSAFDAGDTGNTGSAKYDGKKSPADKTKQSNKDLPENGNCWITLPFSKLFPGTLTMTERLSGSIESLKDSFVSVSLSEPLLSQAQAQKLNPLVIHIHAATAMPSTPVSFEELQLRCQPAYVRYNIPDLPTHTSSGLLQGQNLYWDDINVILAGTLDSSQMKEFLGGHPFEVEVHDRDRLVHKYEEASTLFGEETDDGMLGSSTADFGPVAVIQNKVWDPFGVAWFDLSDLLLGQTVLELQSTILNSSLPDKSITSPPVGPDGHLIAPPGVTQGPIEPPLRAGDYIQSDATLKIKVHLAYPLTTTTDLTNFTSSQSVAECPFARMVCKFPYDKVYFLNTLMSRVKAVNAKALQLDVLPKHDLDTALTTFKLTTDQQQSPDLDILTGFHITDPEMHLIILEGLRNGAIKDIGENICADLNQDVMVLYHSNVGFCKRLYCAFDVDLFCIKLHDSLSVILHNPLVYIRDVVPCLHGLIKLQALSQSHKLRDAVRNDLFPSPESIVCLSREFGVPITANHFIVPLSHVDVDMMCELPSNGFLDQWPEPEHVTTEPSDQQNLSELQTWQALDTDTELASNPNIIHRNKVSVSKMSENIHFKRSKTLPVMIEGRTTEEAMDKLRRILHENDPDHLYTFCPEFHHSMTLSKNTLHATLKEDAQKSRQRWLTSEGWRNQNRILSGEINRHPMRPHSARIIELKIPLDELYDTSQEEFMFRNPFPWDYRKQDLNIWTKPPEFQKVPIASHIEIEQQSIDRARLAEEKKKEFRLKVASLEGGRTHRCAIATELQERGPLACSQLDRLRGTLKDAPQRLILRSHPATVPALSVVQYPNVDTSALVAGAELKPVQLNQTCPKGLTVGPHRNRRLTAKNNQIPLPDYQRQEFARLKGKDFNIYHKEKAKVYMRRIQPLPKCESTEYRSLWRCGHPHQRLSSRQRLTHVNVCRNSESADTAGCTCHLPIAVL